MKASSITHKVQIGVLAVCLSILLICIVFSVTALNPIIIRHYVDKYSTVQEREDITNNVLSFLSYNDDLAYFTNTEQAHMRDVRQLITIGKATAVIALLGCIALITTTYLRSKKHAVADTSSLLNRALVWTGISLATLICIALLVDFSVLFSTFHKILFPQGNYLFSEDSLLIRTFPEAFFKAMGVLFGTVLLCVSMACIVLSVVLKRVRNKRNA
ncbi:MAG: DUF1461 domain-containing protein [archaeon]